MSGAIDAMASVGIFIFGVRSALGVIRKRRGLDRCRDRHIRRWRTGGSPTSRDLPTREDPR